MSNDEHLNVYCHPYIIFGDYIFRPFASIFWLDCLFSYCWVSRVSSKFWYEALIGHIVCKYHLVRSLSYNSLGTFCRVKVFNLTKSLFSVFSVPNHAFSVIGRNLSPNSYLYILLNFLLEVFKFYI